jgi:hypothetical protein
MPALWMRFENPRSHNSKRERKRQMRRGVLMQTGSSCATRDYKKRNRRNWEFHQRRQTAQQAREMNNVV